MNWSLILRCCCSIFWGITKYTKSRCLQTGVTDLPNFQQLFRSLFTSMVHQKLRNAWKPTGLEVLPREPSANGHFFRGTSMGRTLSCRWLKKSLGDGLQWSACDGPPDHDGQWKRRIFDSRLGNLVTSPDHPKFPFKSTDGDDVQGTKKGTEVNCGERIVTNRGSRTPSRLTV